jgi:ketosteroid isomerase-like protein
MKSRHLLVIVFFVLSAILSHAQQKSDSLSAVLELEEKWNDAYKRGDIDVLNLLLADDFIITIEDGSTYSKAGYIARLGGSSEHVDVSQMADLKVRVHGNVAIVTGAYHEKGTSKGKPYEFRDRLTDVWVNGGHRWQLIASHYSIAVKE